MGDRFELEPLMGLRVLVVEDDWLIAEVLCQELQDSGAEVLGPAPSLTDALGLLDEHGLPDAAVLDVELKDAKSYPVAERLTAGQVPVVFTTGRPCSEIAEYFPGAPCVGKSVSPITLVRLLIET